jgi:hypothetical protein
MTPEELRKARQSVGKASADASGDSSESEADASESDPSGDNQRQMSRRAEALIARQAEEAKKKQEKK